MVLDCVVSPSWQQLCNLGPLIAPLLVCLVDDVILLVGPGTLLDGRVQVVMPSLPALLPDAPLQVLGDQGPSFGTVLLHQLDDLLILLFGPGSLHQLGIDDLVPPLLALDVVPVGEASGDHLPLLAVLLHQPFELLVLVLGPAPLVDVLLDPRARGGGGVFVVHRGLVDLVLVAQLVIRAPLFVDVAAVNAALRHYSRSRHAVILGPPRNRREQKRNRLRIVFLFFLFFLFKR